MWHLPSLVLFFLLFALAGSQQAETATKAPPAKAQLQTAPTANGSQGSQSQEKLILKAEACRKAGDLAGLAKAYVALAAFARSRFDWGKANTYNDQAQELFERLKDAKKIAECSAFRDEIWAEIQKRSAFMAKIEAAERSLRDGDTEKAFELASHCASVGAYDDRTASIMGNYYLSKGMLAQAMTCFIRAIELRPEVGESYVMLALTKLAQKDRIGAEYWIEAGGDFLPETALTYYCKGQVEYANGKFAEAVPCFEKAIELDPNMAKAWKCLIASYEALYDRVTARQYSQRFASELAGLKE